MGICSEPLFLRRNHLPRIQRPAMKTRRNADSPTIASTYIVSALCTEFSAHINVRGVPDSLTWYQLVKINEVAVEIRVENSPDTSRKIFLILVVELFLELI